MDSYYDVFEIASVIDDFWLVDAQSYRRRYSSSHGKPIEPGYYVINWPDYVQVRRFNEQAEFYGAFKSLDEAQATLDWMYKIHQQCLQRISANRRYRCSDSDFTKPNRQADEGVAFVNESGIPRLDLPVGPASSKELTEGARRWT